LTDEREEVRSRIDIVNLVSQDGIRLKKVGKNYTGLCPFHADKRPSFYVMPDSGRYKCFSCGEAGDVFTFVMKRRSLDFPEALRLLAKEAGITLASRGAPAPNRQIHETAMEEALAFFREQFGRSSQAQEYCARRDIDAETLDRWEIGYAPDVGEALAAHLKRKGLPLVECKALFLIDQDPSGGYFDKFRGRLMFPIRDERGQLVAFGGRLLGDGHPKYINSSDTPLYRKSRVLYGLNRARERVMKERKAVLVEGYLDVIACHRADVGGAVASLGTSLSDEHAKLLKRWCDEVAVLYDSDAAGQKAAQRAVEMLEAEGVRVRVALMPPGDDPDTLLRTAGPEAVRKAVDAGLTPTAYRMQAVEKRLGPEQEEFWSEAVSILADARTEPEVLSHVDRLSAVFPGTRDLSDAKRILLRQVAKARKSRREHPEDERPQVVFEHKTLRGSLATHEIVVFSAFLSESFRRFGWLYARAPQLFETGIGQALSQAIIAAFPEPPVGSPATWIHRIEDESLRQALSDLLLDFRAENISETVLADAVTGLKNRKDERDLQEQKRSGVDRNEIFKRLKDRKPDPRIKKEDDDFF